MDYGLVPRSKARMSHRCPCFLDQLWEWEVARVTTVMICVGPVMHPDLFLLLSTPLLSTETKEDASTRGQQNKDNHGNNNR
jgi:hypothetical protein